MEVTDSKNARPSNEFTKEELWKLIESIRVDRGSENFQILLSAFMREFCFAAKWPLAIRQSYWAFTDESLQKEILDNVPSWLWEAIISDKIDLQRGDAEKASFVLSRVKYRIATYYKTQTSRRRRAIGSDIQGLSSPGSTVEKSLLRHCIQVDVKSFINQVGKQFGKKQMELLKCEMLEGTEYQKARNKYLERWNLSQAGYYKARARLYTKLRPILIEKELGPRDFGMIA